MERLWRGHDLRARLGLCAVSVNRANRPVTRWCHHGAAVALAFMTCAMHYALTASATAIPDTSVLLNPELIPAKMLGVDVVGAVLLVTGSGFSSYTIDLRSRTESADRIHQLSFNDTMTGLPNRIAFNERLFARPVPIAKLPGQCHLSPRGERSGIASSPRSSRASRHRR